MKLSPGITLRSIIEPKNISIIFFILFLSACGGGGSNNQADPSPVGTNTAPHANAGIDQIVDANDVVTLTGVGTDSEGTVTYAWSQSTGPALTLSSSTDAVITFTAPELTQDTTFDFLLTVTDSGNVTATDIVRVTVSATTPDTIPTVTVPENFSAEELTNIELEAIGSDAESGVTYSWTQILGTPAVLNNQDTSTLAIALPDVNAEEALTFEVVVIDDANNQVSANVVITVTPIIENVAPDVNAGNSQNVIPQAQVFLEGIVSDSDGTIDSTMWSQISGELVVINNPSSVSASFTAPSLGQDTVLVFELAATDDDGDISTDQVEITVLASAPNTENLTLLEGDLAPGFDDGATVKDILRVVFGEDGQVAIAATVTLGSGGTSNVLWLGQPNAPRLVLKTNDEVEGYPAGVRFDSVETRFPISINGVGEVMFSVNLNGPTNGVALLYADSLSLVPVDVILPQQLIDDGFSIFSHFPNYYLLKNNGAIIRANIANSVNPSFIQGEALWHWEDGISTLVQGFYFPTFGDTDIASLPLDVVYPVGTDCVPTIAGVAADVGNLVDTKSTINNDGDIALRTGFSVIGSNNRSCPQSAIVKWTKAENQLTSIVEQDQLIPGSVNIFSLDVFSIPAINDDGDVSFIAAVSVEDALGGAQLALFEYNSLDEMKYLAVSSEKLPNQPASNLQFNLEGLILYSSKFGYLIPMVNLDTSFPLIVSGEGIDYPYSNLTDIGETHLDVFLSAGDSLPDASDTVSLKADRLDFTYAPMVNSEGNYAFIGVASDVLGQVPDTTNIYGMRQQDSLVKLLDFQSDQVVSAKLSQPSFITQIFNFRLLDDNSLMLFVLLDTGEKAIVRFTTPLN